MKGRLLCFLFRPRGIPYLVPAILACGVLSSCSPASEGSPSGTPIAFAEYSKRGDLSLFIIGDYFHGSFANELVQVAKGISPRDGHILICTERVKRTLMPLLTVNGARNCRFSTVPESSPILRQWARDIAIAGRRNSEKIIVATPDKHARSKEESEYIGVILQRLLPEWTVIVAPFVFEGGNLVFLEAGGQRILIAGRKLIFDNETYQKRPWAAGMGEQALLQSVAKTFEVDTVLVVGRSRTRPPGRLYFEYHLDMGMAVLGGNRAVVSKLSFDEEERALLARAVNNGGNVLSPFVSHGSDSGVLLDVLSDRLSVVASEYEDYASLLDSLGVEVYRSPVSWLHVLSSMSWTNVLQTTNQIVMPLYPDSVSGRATCVTDDGGYLAITLDVSHLDQERFAVNGYNHMNYDLYRTLGYEVIVSPEYLHYFMGGIHCLVNLLE